MEVVVHHIEMQLQMLQMHGVTVVSSSGNEAVEGPWSHKGILLLVKMLFQWVLLIHLITELITQHITMMVDVAAPGGTTGTDINGDGQADGILAFDGK